MNTDFYFVVLDYVFHVYPLQKEVVIWFKDFIAKPVEDAIEIRVTKEMVKKEEELLEEPLLNPALIYEKTAIHRAVTNILLKKNVFLFHGSAFIKDGYAFIFAGKSGAGKSTHARLWRVLFEDEITIINDDKPYLRLENNQIVVYGSPWNGKHHLGTNSCAPLKAIGIIHQSNENACVPLSKKDAYLPLFCQIYRPEDPVDLMNTMDFIQRIIDSVNIYDIYCMKDIEAARVSHKVMND